MDELTLQSGPLSVGVLPAIGGAITHFRSSFAFGDIEWMRPWVDRGRGALDTASFVTVPFFSWLERDQFHFNKRFVDLQPSGFGFDRCLLGLGWTSAWKVEEATRDRLVLSHANPGGNWPWPYRAEQTLELDAEGLVIAVTLRNDDDEPMPGGLGLAVYAAPKKCSSSAALRAQKRCRDRLKPATCAQGASDYNPSNKIMMPGLSYHVY